MKTHRPWQPHMSNTPLFNPYTPDEPAAERAPLSQRPGSE